MRIAGLVVADTGRKYDNWRQAWVVSAVGTGSRGLEQRSSSVYTTYMTCYRR